MSFQTGLYSVPVLLLAMVHAAVSIQPALKNNPLRCSTTGADGYTFNVTDGVYKRCFSAIVPQSGPRSRPLPVLFYFHGWGGSAFRCGENGVDIDHSMSLKDYAEKYGFALVCGEALQDVFAKGGQWTIPQVQTDATGPRCNDSDSPDVRYLKAVVAQLEKRPDLFDTNKLFTSGCSMGSAFSEYIGGCMHSWYGSDRIPAFATHSAGLKIKGDGNIWPPDIYNMSTTAGECEDCQYFPTVPREAPGGLKACLNDNSEDPDPNDPFFYRSTKQMAEVWKSLGNRAETHYYSGAHCEIHSYWDIISCLDDGTKALIGNGTAPNAGPNQPL